MKLLDYDRMIECLTEHEILDEQGNICINFETGRLYSKTDCQKVLVHSLNCYKSVAWNSLDILDIDWVQNRNDNGKINFLNNCNDGTMKHFLGKHHTEETKRRISEKNKGKHYRENFHHTEETKRKIGEAGKGRLHSEESKLKMSIAAKKRWERLRINKLEAKNI